MSSEKKQFDPREPLTLEVRIDKKIDYDFDVMDILHSIDTQPIRQKWNLIAHLINNVDEDITELDDEAKTIIKNWLERKLELLK